MTLQESDSLRNRLLITGMEARLSSLLDYQTKAQKFNDPAELEYCNEEIKKVTSELEKLRGKENESI